MAEIVHLGSQAGRLTGELAAALAVVLTQRDANPGRKGSKFFHGFEADLEVAHHALVSVGVFAASPEGPSPMPPEAWHFELAMDADQMPEFVANRIEDGDGRQAVMLDAFLRVACRQAGLPTSHHPFSPAPAFARAMVALARAGYAERVGDAFKWTDRIGPAMRHARLW